MYAYPYDKIKKAAKYQCSKQGYVDLNLLEKMHNIPIYILENILKDQGFEESNTKGQFIKIKKGK